VILVDTSVWIDHLRAGDPDLVARLEEAVVCSHPMVIGELALGSLRDRKTVLDLLRNLPVSTLASHAEVLHLIESHALFGLGLALVDVHLLASSLISSDVQLWTRDRRLLAAAQRLEVAAST
jgi:predicted nucleic acid-binding protein